MFNLGNLDFSFVNDLPKRACQGPCRGLFVPADPRYRFCPACHASLTIYVPTEYLAGDADPLVRKLAGALRTALANNASDGTPLQKALVWAMRTIALPADKAVHLDVSTWKMSRAFEAIAYNVFAKLHPDWDKELVSQTAMDFLDWTRRGIENNTPLKPEESPGWVAEPVVKTSPTAPAKTVPDAATPEPVQTKAAALTRAPEPARVPPPALTRVEPKPQQPLAQQPTAKPETNHGQKPKFTPESVGRILLKAGLGLPRREKAEWIRGLIARQADRYTADEIKAILAKIDTMVPPLNAQSAATKLTAQPVIKAGPPLSAEELKAALTRPKAERPAKPAPKATAPKPQPKVAPAAKSDDLPNLGTVIAFAKAQLGEGVTKDAIIAAFKDAGRSADELARFTLELDREIERKQQHAARMASAAARATDLSAGAMKMSPEPKSKQGKDAGKQKNKKAQHAQQQAQA